MEAYKTTCPDCRDVRYWTGYKTDLGKSPEQLEQMSKEYRICVNCGSEKAKTELDHESATGQILDEQAQVFVQSLCEALKGRE